MYGLVFFWNGYVVLVVVYVCDEDGFVENCIDDVVVVLDLVVDYYCFIVGE